MLNYYELLKVFGLENENAVAQLRESFNSDFRAELQKMQINNTTRKNAIIAYSKHDQFFMDAETPGAYCDGVTALYVPNNAIVTTTKNADVTRFFTDAFKSRKPVDGVYIKESVGVARAIGWTPGVDPDKRYHIEVNGNYYNFTLVYQIFCCIADNKINSGVERVELCNMDNSGREMLLLSTKYGTGLILPYCAGNEYKARNVSFSYYMETENEIDNYIIQQACKTA